MPAAFHSLDEIRRRGPNTCGILGILGVLHNGHASLCGIGEVVKELDFGDLTVLGVKRIWEETPLLRQLRQQVPRGLGGVCARCLLKHYCLGKCLAHTYSETGDLFGGFAFCEQAHAQGLFPATRLAYTPQPEVSAP